MNTEINKRNLEDLFLTKGGNFRKKDFALYVNKEDNLISIEKDFNKIDKICILTLIFKDFNISFTCDIKKGTTALNLEKSKEILDYDDKFISKLFDNIYKECIILRKSIIDVYNSVSQFSKDEDKIISQIIDENELKDYEFIYGKWKWWMKLNYKEFNIFFELESTGDHDWDLLCDCSDSFANEAGECIKCGEEGSRYVDGISSKILNIIKDKTSFKFNKKLEKEMISKFIESDLYHKLLEVAEENESFNEVGRTLTDHVYDNYL
jgi:hypothetical protein